MTNEVKQYAGHQGVMGETLAKYEFAQNGWNPYSHFFDVGKVDFLLRREKDGTVDYREVQVKYGKLYSVGSGWERALFDVTSWRFFQVDEFKAARPDLYLTYVMSRDDHYLGDLFVFPIQEFAALISRAPLSGGKHKVYISRQKDSSRWFLRCQPKFEAVTDESCAEVTSCYRAFNPLDRGA